MKPLSCARTCAKNLEDRLIGMPLTFLHVYRDAVDRIDLLSREDMLGERPSGIHNAMNHHHGMQSEERFGAGADHDNDGVIDELTVGDITALTVFQAALPAPG